MSRATAAGVLERSYREGADSEGSWLPALSNSWPKIVKGSAGGQDGVCVGGARSGWGWSPGLPERVALRAPGLTRAGADVLRAHRLPHQVVLVQPGAVFCHHHRLGSVVGPDVDDFGIRIGVCIGRQSDTSMAPSAA